MATAIKEHENEEVPHWMQAKAGIKLLINNHPREAQEIFSSHPDSLPMCAGYSFAAFMDALMTFEEDRLHLATSVLKDVERKCSSESGWFRSMKKAFGSTENASITDTLETQIILADSQVCLAILTFLQQDISGYFKGSWVLRKAWKVYQSAYNEILQLYKEVCGDSDKQLPEAVLDFSSNPTSSRASLDSPSKTDLTPKSEDLPPPPNGYNTAKKLPTSHSTTFATPNSTTTTKTTHTLDTLLKKSFSANSALYKHQLNHHWHTLSYFTSTFHLFSSTDNGKPPRSTAPPTTDRATVERLMGAVSFGYGLFQLGISLLPPSLLKLTNFLGFGGNRQNGISCLMYAREGVDMRAPLATLSLLWYHTIVRPFYALDGSNVQAGVNAALLLLQEAEEEYGQSALFLFFKGRVNRLNSDIPHALASFQKSVDNAAQREIKILSMHEVGWCHLIQLDYCNAETTFSYLKSWSRWSRAFYTYLAGICCGSCQASDNFTNIREIKNAQTVHTKNNQLDEFLNRRAKCCPSDEEDLSRIPAIFWKLLVYEMLYLWNALPSCSPGNIENIKNDCESVPSDGDFEPMRGLSKLILGCCNCIQREYSLAVQDFKMCLELRKELPHNASDAHVSAFSQYELGALLIKTEETNAEGKMLLQNISSYKDYDFEQRLNVRVHSMLKHM